MVKILKCKAMAEGLVNFTLIEDHFNIIKVIGVGGGGGNAVRHMAERGIRDVDFVICNTDSQVMNDEGLGIEYIQLGAELTGGYGAGNEPERGRRAAEESLAEVEKILGGHTKMVFVTAAMGGGTGTGAAPVIASMALERGLLVVGVVTVPARFEGPKRINNAKRGVEEMERAVDCLIVIENERIQRIHKDARMLDAFGKANDVLLTAAKGIAEIITLPGYINVDFADVKTVMKGSGVATMGAAVASGPDRALTAIRESLESPLLSNDILGAKNILFNITSGEEEIRTDELKIITDYIIEKVGGKASVIWGVGEDMSLGDGLSVTVIATGYPKGIFTNSPADEIEEASEDGSVEIDWDSVVLRSDLTAMERMSLLEEPAYKRRNQTLRITHGDRSK